MAESDPGLLSAEQLAAMREHWFSSGRKDPESLGAKLSQRGDFRVLLFNHLDALTEQLAAADAREGELLAALRADRYLHGVWAWREGLQEGQFGYQRTPEVERVLRAFAALEPPAEPAREAGLEV
jgi:hypothetical protein